MAAYHRVYDSRHLQAALRSVIEYGLPLPLPFTSVSASDLHFDPDIMHTASAVLFAVNQSCSELWLTFYFSLVVYDIVLPVFRRLKLVVLHIVLSDIRVVWNSWQGILLFQEQDRFFLAAGSKTCRSSHRSDAKAGSIYCRLH